MSDMTSSSSISYLSSIGSKLLSIGCTIGFFPYTTNHQQLSSSSTTIADEQQQQQQQQERTCDFSHGAAITTPMGVVLVFVASFVLGMGLLKLRDKLFGCEIGEVHKIDMRKKIVEEEQSNLQQLRFRTKKER